MEKLTLPVPIKLRGIKPFTMVNIAVSNELGLSQEKRVACASIVDLSCRLISLLDDLIDSNWEAVSSQVDIQATGAGNKRQELGAVVSLSTSWIYPLSRHVAKGIIEPKVVPEMIDTYYHYGNEMSLGIAWQDKHGYFDDAFVPDSLPDSRMILEEYVDRIAGGLFAWAVAPIMYYEPTKRKNVEQIIKAVYPFSRIFQINDDIADLMEDLNARQTTVVITAILQQGGASERKTLLELMSNPSHRKMSFKEFASLFPNAFKYITELKDTEYRKLSSRLRNAEIDINTNQIMDVSENYPKLRATMSNLYSLGVTL
ncbi:MAG: class 1 isoprenoid biosynthesis enzyme [Thaumarchaeota archaeon]|nr:class 1 isoprenoid biosynthesis enzyme [Nitrososphaerota archaeon]